MHREVLESIEKIGRYPIKVSEVLSCAGSYVLRTHWECLIKMLQMSITGNAFIVTFSYERKAKLVSSIELCKKFEYKSHAF